MYRLGLSYTFACGIAVLCVGCAGMGADEREGSGEAVAAAILVGDAQRAAMIDATLGLRSLLNAEGLQRYDAALVAIAQGLEAPRRHVPPGLEFVGKTAAPLIDLYDRLYGLVPPQEGPVLVNLVARAWGSALFGQPLFMAVEDRLLLERYQQHLSRIAVGHVSSAIAFGSVDAEVAFVRGSAVTLRRGWTAHGRTMTAAVRCLANLFSGSSYDTLDSRVLDMLAALVLGNRAGYNHSLEALFKDASQVPVGQNTDVIAESVWAYFAPRFAAVQPADSGGV